MIVYLHSSDAITGGRTLARHGSEDVWSVQIPPNTPVSRAAEVVRSAGGDIRGAIDLLVIDSHCSPGRIHLGGEADDTFDITERNAGLFAQPFASMFKPADKGGRGVEILGSYVAAASVDSRTGEIDDPDLGVRFLYTLACGFLQRVTGYASPQTSDAEGTFDGVVVAMPDSDPDWYSYLSRNSDRGVSHGGDFGTRMDTFFTSLARQAPRSRPLTAVGLAPNPGWDRR
jgi:hypothetical protein